MTAVLDLIANATARIGYRADAIVRNYPFSNLTTSGASSTKRAPLAVCAQAKERDLIVVTGDADIRRLSLFDADLRILLIQK